MFENFEEWAKGAIGHTEAEVVEAIVQGGGTARVRSRDGERYMGTCDVVANRANLTVEKGLVTAITFG